jgi:hypothetical protein
MASIPDRGNQIAESRQSSLSSAAADSARHDDARRRWRSKKFSKPLILAGIGVVFLLGALWLYSSPAELPAPSFATIQLKSSFSISGIRYDVSQPSPSIAKITIYVELPGNVVRTPAKAPAADLWLEVPPGITFETCPPDACRFDPNDKEYTWLQTLDFKYEDPDDNSGEAIATFSVKAHSFGYAYNDINASAAIPRVVFLGPGAVQPVLYTEYDVAAANSYQWSTLQPQLINANEVRWDEPVTSAAQGIVAVGVNDANQTRDNTETFISGALIGLAGGALLAAIQEFLHRNDDAATARAMAGALQSYFGDGRVQRSERGEEN